MIDREERRKIPYVIHMIERTSEYLLYSLTETQIIYDMKSDKFYSLQTKTLSARTTNQIYQTSNGNHDYYHEPKSSILKSSSIGFVATEKEKNSTIAKTSLNQQQGNHQQATMWQNDKSEYPFNVYR